MRLFLFLVLFSSTIVHAQDFWTTQQLEELRAGLAENVGPNNAAILDRMIDFDGYFAAMVHREAGPGFSELHVDWADIYFVTAGSASIRTGGDIVDATEATPGEVRGSSIEGGEVRRISEGDVVHIPAGIAHHVLVSEGETVTYFILKAQKD